MVARLASILSRPGSSEEPGSDVRRTEPRAFEIVTVLSSNSAELLEVDDDDMLPLLGGCSFSPNCLLNFLRKSQRELQTNIALESTFLTSSSTSVMIGRCSGSKTQQRCQSCRVAFVNFSQVECWAGRNSGPFPLANYSTTLEW